MTSLKSIHTLLSYFSLQYTRQNTQCCCAKAKLLGLATHLSKTSDHKMIYRQRLPIPYLLLQKIFVRQHYSATHTQVLITYYIAKNLYYWTQDAVDKSFA